MKALGFFISLLLVSCYQDGEVLWSRDSDIDEDRGDTDEPDADDASREDVGQEDADEDDGGSPDADLPETFCDFTSCPTGCCSGQGCVAISFGTCGAPGATCLSCDAVRADRCNLSGECACGDEAPCDIGQRCVDHECVCDEVSCPTGCCWGETCTVPSLAACGFGGDDCVACDPVLADDCSFAGDCICAGDDECESGQVCKTFGCEGG